MCSKYALYSSIKQIKLHFPIDLVEAEVIINYNIAPAQKITAMPDTRRRIS